MAIVYYIICRHVRSFQFLEGSEEVVGHIRSVGMDEEILGLRFEERSQFQSNEKNCFAHLCCNWSLVFKKLSIV